MAVLVPAVCFSSHEVKVAVNFLQFEIEEISPPKLQ